MGPESTRGLPWVRRLASQAWTLVALLLPLACAVPPIGDLHAEERAGLALRAPGLQALAWARAESRPEDPEGGAPPLDGDRAVSQALQRHPGVQAALWDLGVVRADLEHGTRPGNPSLEGLVRIFSAGTDAEASLLVPLLGLVLHPERARVAGLELEAARAEAASRLLQMALEIRLLLLRAQAAEARLAVHEEARALASEEERLGRLLLAAGNVAEWEIAEQTLAAAEAEFQLHRAQARSRELRLRLAGAICLIPEDRGTIRLAALPRSGAPEPGRIGDLLSAALAENQELRALSARSKASRTRAGIAPAEAWTRDAGLGLAASREQDGSKGLGPALTVPVPIFQAGGWTGLREEARARAEEARRADRELGLREAVPRLAGALADRHAELRLLRERLRPLAERRTTLVLQRYNAMQIGVFPVLAARAAELALDLREIDLLEEGLSLQVELQTILLGGNPRPPSKDGSPGGEGSFLAGRMGGH